MTPLRDDILKRVMDGLEKLHDKLECVDKRLTALETKASIWGGVWGGLAGLTGSIIVAIFAYYIRGS